MTALDDLSSGRRENLPPGVPLLQADVRDPGLVRDLAGQGFEVVNHHAAQVSVPASVADPRHDAEVNLLGLLNLLEAARAWGARRFLCSYWARPPGTSGRGGWDSATGRWGW